MTNSVFRAIWIVCVLAFSVRASDPYCSVYTKALRLEDADRREGEMRLAAFRASAKRTASAVASSRNVEARNFIDTYIAAKLSADGVPAAPRSSDAEFLRRVFLDVTGEIPSPETVQSFLADDAPDKRSRLIDSLVASEAYVDRWALWLRDKFQITSRYYQYIPIEGRNRFDATIRDHLTRDLPYSDLARGMISAEGLGSENGLLNYLVRGYQNGDPIQDTYDTLVDRTTVKFLGFKTECVSCHDGRRHLEEINLYLTRQKRTDFWRMSAFFSRMNLRFITMDAFNRQFTARVNDVNGGAYMSIVSSSNPGPRPYRYGGPYTPKFMLNGEEPKSGEWRKEFARMVTESRQFARASVNYIWEAMFGRGIVDPADNWDLDRIDPKNPPPAPFTLQSSHPELLEALADEFIRSNYSIKTIVRAIAESGTYQLSSQYEGAWRPEYVSYFARYEARRLGPEELLDAISRATLTETPYWNSGESSPVLKAARLLDASEPRDNFSIRNFLTQAGRGDYWNLPHTAAPTVLQSLFLMNDNTVNFRTLPNRDGGRANRVTEILASRMSDEEAIQLLYRATLSRPATAAEVARVMAGRSGLREQWLGDLQWALLNKLDFLFNY